MVQFLKKKEEDSTGRNKFFQFLNESIYHCNEREPL